MPGRSAAHDASVSEDRGSIRIGSQQIELPPSGERFPVAVDTEGMQFFDSDTGAAVWI